jgi:aspartyl-tRNA synthetase
MINRFRAEDGDVIMMIADTSLDMAHRVLDRLRLHVAKRLGLIPGEVYAPLWITDFPLFELKDGELSSQHHPFTMPSRSDFDPSDKEAMLSLNSRAYDLVMNGEELGGGSIRIHRMDIQAKIFQALGLTRDEIENKFGFFLRALDYGAPPHGGIALGLDRVIAMILNASSIRDVIAFPKNRSAFCPLSHAPSPADREQLEELGIVAGRGLDGFEVGIEISSLKGTENRAAKKSKKISKKEVQHVAKLARLKLEPEEIASIRKDLNAILGYVEELQELNTADVRPMSHVLKLKNVWREDIPRKRKETDPLLSNAPVREKDYFRVPKILEG